MKKNKSINREEINGILNKLTEFYIATVLVLLPLITYNGYSCITATKSKVFYVLTVTFVVVSALILLYRAIICRPKALEFYKNMTYTDFAMILYGFFIVISSITSDYYKDVWYGQGARYQGCITLLLYIVVYFLISSNFSFSGLSLIVTAMAFVFVCIIGLFNAFDADVLGIYSVVEENRKKICISTIGNINFYSSYICLIFPFLICGFCQVKDKKSITIYAVSVVIGTVGAMLTSSESFVVGFVVSFIAMTILFFEDANKIRRLSIISIVILLIAQIYRVFATYLFTLNYEISYLLEVLTNPAITAILVVVFLCISIFSVKKNEKLRLMKLIFICMVLFAGLLGAVCFVLINTVFANKDFGVLEQYLKFSAQWGSQRGEIWSICLDIFKNADVRNKLLGFGPETLRFLTKDIASFEGRVLDQAHNEYLQHLLTIGIFGVTAYVAMIVSTAITALKHLKNNSLATAFFVALVAYWVQAFFNIAQPFTTPVMYIFIACIGGIYKAKLKNQSLRKGA